MGTYIAQLASSSSITGAATALERMNISSSALKNAEKSLKLPFKLLTVITYEICSYPIIIFFLFSSNFA
jgi:hypothetical protein